MIMTCPVSSALRRSREFVKYPWKVKDVNIYEIYMISHIFICIRNIHKQKDHRCCCYIISGTFHSENEISVGVISLHGRLETRNFSSSSN